MVKSKSSTTANSSFEDAFVAEPAQSRHGVCSARDNAVRVQAASQGEATGGHPSVNSKAKRVIDVVASFLGLLILSPLFGIVSALVRLDSTGPIIFEQKRVGLNGKSFTFYKFRSMYQNSSSEVHKEYIRGLIQGTARPAAGSNSGEKIFKLAEDQRVTRLGRFLRRTSLDELPQLVNVLRGDMSLVGPRPAIGYEIEMYKNWYKPRLTVRPGITGLWQISGRSERTFEEMVELDLKYIDNWSLLLDLKTIWHTIFVVFRRQGAW